MRNPAFAARPRSRPRVAAVAGLAFAVAVGGACTSGGGGSGSDTAAGTTAPVPSAPATLPPTTAAPTTTLVTVLDVPAPEVASSVWVRADQPGEAALPPEFQAMVVGFVQAFVATTTAAPATGRPSAVEPFLTEGARARLDDTQRRVLADDGLPRLAQATLAPPQLTLTAVTGRDGATVTAVGLTVELTGTTPAGAPVSVRRSGELTLVADGANLAVDAFRLTVDTELP